MTSVVGAMMYEEVSSEAVLKIEMIVVSENCSRTSQENECKVLEPKKIVTG